MKKIFLILLVSGFTSTSYVKAQNAKNNVGTGSAWANNLYKTWKVTELKGMPGASDYAINSSKTYWITLNKSGSFVGWNDVFLYADSFVAFESLGRKFLMLGPYTFKIGKMSDDLVEMKLSMPIYKTQVTSFTLISGSELPPKPQLQFLTGKTWVASGNDKYAEIVEWSDGKDYIKQKKTAFLLNEDHSYTMLKDSILTKGSWNVDNNLILMLDDGGRKVKWQLKSYSGQAMLVNNLGAKDSFFTIYQEYGATSPEEMQKERKEKTSGLGTNKRPGYMEAPRETPQERKEKVEAMFVNTYKATKMMKTGNYKEIPFEDAITISFQKDYSLVLKIGKKSYKGSWKSFGSFEGNASLILEYDGEEHYSPITITKEYNKPLKNIKSIHLTMHLPGKKELVGVYFLADGEDK